MSVSTETTQAAKTAAVEIGKAAAKATVQTAVELAAAAAILTAAGFTVSVIQERKAKKLAKKAETK